MPDQKTENTQEKKTASRKRKRRPSVVWRLVMLAAVAVLVFSLWQLVRVFQNYREVDEDYGSITAQMEKRSVPVPVTTAAPGEESESNAQEKEPGEESEEGETGQELVMAVPQETEEPYELTVPDFDYLRGVNEYVIGWIQIPGTKINYPVVQGTDNEYWLSHTFENKEKFCGAIFMDAGIEDRFDDKNPIIYGHNLRSGSMFSRLNRYAEKEFWDENPYIYITTPDELIICQVFSAYQTTADADIYYFGFGSDDQFQAYIDRVTSYSVYDAGITVTKEDSIVTLSTCANDVTQRFVVHAKRIQN
ncbi:MAG: class B sortase [Lachnospiraceae bacterium]|jgi:sortase B|nr:class B sortase [Lachnospiraceae bacterium]